ncbi:MAG: hypothetical protein AB7O92_19195 [Acidimicrobiia bacterium]
MARHQQNERRDVLAGLTVHDANALVARLAEAGIRASAFSAGSIASDLFPTTDAGVEVIVAPEDRAEALRIAEAFAAEAADSATDAAADTGPAD